MHIMTRDFGEVEVMPHNVVDFVQPIYGFESLSKYVVLQDKSIGKHFIWLQSIDDRDVCFILTEPAYVTKNYPPVLSEDILKLLRKNNINNPKYWVMMVIPKSFKDATVNLKSPVLIDQQAQKGVQIILDEDYPLRCPLLTRENGRV